MKVFYLMILLMLCLTLLMPTAWGQASGTSYKLHSGTPVGGGGTSSTGAYKVSGAIPLTAAGVSGSSSYGIIGQRREF